MDRFSFSDDTPRFDPWTEDDFGYRPFAKHLADVLIKMPAPGGYVIGLHGVWGTGKTSALNFVAHFLDAHNKEVAAGRSRDKPIEVVLFQPWMVSGQQDLISSFFRVLAEKMKDGVEPVKKAKRRFGKAARLAVDPLVKSTVAVAAAAHPPDAVAIKASGEMAKRAMEQTIDAWLGEPTLQEAHDDLNRRLRKSGRRFVVMIDDIDRLEASEIRSIVQMVKSVGRLANVTYLLAYDRRIVWRALSERDVQAAGEPTFTEKIVQHELELPRIQKSRLLRRLDREAAFVLKKVTGGRRWNEILTSGIHRWVKSPRDIVRFSNALRFTWPPLEGAVDAGDFMAMEGLRLFEADVFDWIRANRSFLVDSGVYVPDDEKKRIGKAFRDMIPEDRAAAIELVAVLFPSRSKLLKVDDRFGYSELYADTVNRGGVGSTKGFDSYFEAYPSEFTIPKELIDRAAANPDDRAIQDEVLKVAIETKNEDGYSCIGEYLEELQFRLVGSFKMKSGSAVIPALLAKAPLIESLDYPERTGFSPPMLLQSLLRQLLEELGVEAASKILVEAADASNSASVVASLYVWRGRESGKIPLEGERIKPLISDEAYDAIGARALKLIESEAASGTLKAAPFYFDIVRAWSFLDSVDVAKAWLSEVIASDAHALAKTTWGFLAYSVRDDGGRHYAFRGLAEMAPYHDREILLAAAERFADSPDLSPDERARIVAVRDGLRGALAREQAAQAQEAGGPVPEADGARPAAAPMARPRRRAARSEPRPPADGAFEAAES